MKESHLKVKGFAAFVIAAVCLISFCNFFHQMCHAENKEFWGDEIYSLKRTVHEFSYLGLIGKAAILTEANPAPLDYIFTKGLKDIKQAVGSFGVSDKVYYRLWANFAMVFCGFLVICLFARNILHSSTLNSIKMFQLLLLIFLPFVYLYRPLTYHYAAEMRPYSLWFALWFICIGICSLPRVNKFILALCLSLLAMTMVGSVFQILAVGIAYFAVRWRQDGGKQAGMDSLQVFIVPVLLVVFYAYPAAYGHRAHDPWVVSWHQFYELWSHEAIIVPMLLASIGLLYQAKQAQSMIIGPLAVLIVFLMGPLIVLTTLSRGYFFTERQYIYYDAHRAVFWLSLINLLPFYLEKIKDQKKRVLAMAVIFALCVPFVFPKKTMSHIQEVMRDAVSKHFLI